MTGHLLLRGMLVGLVAGLLAFGFARVFGEPQVARAIAFEAASHEAPQAAPAHSHGADAPAHSHAAPAAAESDEIFSRATQAGIGLATATIVYGAAIGGLFALAFAFVRGRIGRGEARGTAAGLAAAAFVAVALVPWLKYPANPPAVGEAGTIATRTGLYFVFLVVCVLTMVAAFWLAKRTALRLGAWNAGLVGVALFVVATGLAGLMLPAVDEVPAAFSASLLWQFRLASLGIQAVLWGAIGLLFGALTERTERAGRPEAGRVRLVHRPA